MSTAVPDPHVPESLDGREEGSIWADERFPQDEVSRETEPQREPVTPSNAPTPGMTPATQGGVWTTLGGLLLAVLSWKFPGIPEAVREGLVTTLVLILPGIAALWARRHTAEFVKGGNVYTGPANDRGTPKAFVRPLSGKPEQREPAVPPRQEVYRTRWVRRAGEVHEVPDGDTGERIDGSLST